MPNAPRLFPLTVAMGVLVWIIATSDRNHVLVKEWLGEAYDSQAEHFLRGDVGVDAGAISSEAMIVNGKVRMYFGPFPAFVRIPLNSIYPSGRGGWSRVSGFFAATIGLFAFSGLIANSLLWGRSWELYVSFYRVERIIFSVGLRSRSSLSSFVSYRILLWLSVTPLTHTRF